MYIGTRHTLPVVDRGIGRLVVLSRKADALFRPEPAHQKDGLPEAALAFLEARPFDAGGGNLVQGFASANTEDNALRGEHAKRRTACATIDG